MDLRLLSALVGGKATKLVNQVSGSGGTAAPGLLSYKLDSQILKKLSADLEKTILVTGTNGKTTTSRILGTFFAENGISYLHNREGSNLERGLISTLLENSDIQGNLNKRVALFEVDEAALAPIISKVSPTCLVITSLFRDQLDRYGEVDSVKDIWLKAIRSLGVETALVLNADDPTVAFLGQNYVGAVIYFGIDENAVRLDTTPQAMDNIKCPVCNSDLIYHSYYLSHQGNYECKEGDFKRPTLDVRAKEIKLTPQGTEFTLVDSSGLSLSIESTLPGLYNVYNILSSYSTLKALGYSLDIFSKTLKNFKPAFGRTETLQLDGRKIVVALAKNPTGFNEVIRTFLADGNKTALVAINDLIADGRDVSWLWDVDFEQLAERNIRFFVSGIRGADLALRLKYAGIKNYTLVNELKTSLEDALASIPQNDTLTIIPTYTAMLQLKKIFKNKGIGGEFWED